jgi:hypothetical protein
MVLNKQLDMICDKYLFTVIGLTPGGSTYLHANSTQNDTEQTVHRTTRKFGKSGGRAPSLRVTP